MDSYVWLSVRRFRDIFAPTVPLVNGVIGTVYFFPGSIRKNILCLYAVARQLSRAIVAGKIARHHLYEGGDVFDYGCLPFAEFSD